VGWWRPLVGVLVLAFLVFVFLPVVLAGVFSALSGVSVTDLVSGDTTPLSLAFLNVTLATAIPVSIGLMVVLHQLSPGLLASVTGRLRWRWMLTCTGLAFVALVATVIVSTLLPAQGEGTELGSTLNPWTSTLRDFVLVVLFLTPLQAAGEEYAFRGYLTQAFGGIFQARWAAVLFPAVLFALAHGAQDAPIFVDRLAFGLVSGTLVILTGGLEAGIAMHVLNNFLAFGLALAYTDMTSALNPTGGSWWNLPVTLTQSLTYLALALWAARRWGIATTAPPGGASELEGLRPRV
jgi:uncharacterized protein